MYNIIPLVIILFSLGVIITIIVKKFSVLASLDVDTIQAERETRMKEQIIGSRLKRNFFRYYHKAARLVVPASKGITSFFSWTYRKLKEAKESGEPGNPPVSGGEDIIGKLMIDADDLVKKGTYDEAERKYIEIIGVDSHQWSAFKKLGQLYYERKDYNEAKQTLEHAMRLIEKDQEKASLTDNSEGDGTQKDAISSQIAEIYFDLSEVNLAMESPANALQVINQALRIEPNNPRYLDIKFEISIISKDKSSALDAYGTLKEVNPENQKLNDFKRQLDEL